MTDLTKLTDDELFDEIETAMTNEAEATQFNDDTASKRISGYASRVMDELERRGLMMEAGEREEVA